MSCWYAKSQGNGLTWFFMTGNDSMYMVYKVTKNLRQKEDRFEELNQRFE
jgi:hypothetical protein